MNQYRKKRKTRTLCYCPRCGNELISSGSPKSENQDIVTFTCSFCETETEWLFDAGPSPILCTIDGQAEKLW